MILSLKYLKQIRFNKHGPNIKRKPANLRLQIYEIILRSFVDPVIHDLLLQPHMAQSSSHICF